MNDSSGPLFVLLFILIYIVVILGVSALMWWKVFEKAGRPGWASIVPIYNWWVLFEIGGKPGAYVLLYFIPCVGPILVLIFMIMACIEIARRFGQSEVFGLGLVFLGIIFFPILGFGDYQYRDPGSRRRRPRYDDEYDDDYDDRPRRRSRDDYDDDYDDRPRRRPRDDY